MKKPVDNYMVQYPVCETSKYYGDCETNNYSCDMCNFAANYGGSGNGSGNGGSVGARWGK